MESWRVGGIECHFCWGGEKKSIFCVCMCSRDCISFIISIDAVFAVVMVMYQKLQVMVTSFGCCRFSGDAPRVPIVGVLATSGGR